MLLSSYDDAAARIQARNISLGLRRHADIVGRRESECDNTTARRTCCGGQRQNQGVPVHALCQLFCPEI